MSDKDTFNYSYSAPTEKERAEIENIKKQYISKENVQKTKLDRLRELHGKVKNPAIIIGVTIGVMGLLIFGSGLAMALEFSMVVWGIIVSAVGIVVMCVNYPLYKYIIKLGKAKYGDEILKLTDELLEKDE